MLQSRLRIALINFFFAALLGLILRYAFVAEIPGMNYRFVLHGHSHVAMLGWIYMALFTLMTSAWLPEKTAQNRFYQTVFNLTEASVIGMLLSFPLTGYAPVSIFFSTLHVVLSYLFVWRFLKDLPPKPAISKLFIRGAIFFMVLSSLGLWAMGPVMALDMKGSTLYYMAVQFYLHFQFNGWFVFGVLGLFFLLLEEKNIMVHEVKTRRFFWLLVGSCLLTYALALTWANREMILFGVNSLGVIIQAIALVYFLLVLQPVQKELRDKFLPWTKILMLFSFGSLVLKILVQSVVVIPYFATIGYTIRNFVIGFIHLIMLGVISHFLFSYALERRVFDVRNVLFRIGIWLFFSGFLGSELLLLIQGLMFWGAKGFIPGYYFWLMTVSALIPLGILGIGLGGLKSSSH